MADENKPVEYNVFNLDTVPKPKRTLSLKRTPVDVEIYRVDQKKPASTPAEKAKEKQGRKVKLAKLLSRTEGGKAEDIYKSLKSLSDEDVQELLLDERFDRYMETPAVGASPDMQAKLSQANKNSRDRQRGKLESEQEFINRQTGVLTSNQYEETENLLTPETILAGKVKAAGLNQELNELIAKKRRYGNSPRSVMEGAFTKDELELFSEIDRGYFNINMIAAPTVKSSMTHLDFGGGDGADEQEQEFTEVNAAYDLKDRGTPASMILSMFKAAHLANSGGSYDVLPALDVVSNIEEEYTVKLSQENVPEYANLVSKKLPGETAAMQQAKAIGLSGVSQDINQLYDALAGQYLDQDKLSNASDYERDAVQRALAGVLQRTVPAGLKGIRAQNSAIIERNKRQTDPLLYENAIASYTAFPAPSEIIEAINSTELRNQVAEYLKPDRGSSGVTVKGVVPDVMSSLLGVGVTTLAYSSFNKADEKKQLLIQQRAGLSHIAGLMSKMHSNMEFAASKRLVEDEQTSLDEAIASGENLDQYQREELARILDVDYIPAGDLSPGYVDDNLTYIDAYAELLDKDAVSREEEPEDTIEIYEADSNNSDGKDYVPEDGMEQLDDLLNPVGLVDNSFAGGAAPVDVDATEGAGVGSVNQQANAGNGLGSSVSHTSATEEARVDSPVARTNRLASTTEESRVDSPVARTNRLASATEEARVDSPATRTNRLASTTEESRVDSPAARTNRPASTTEEARVDSPATRTNQLASTTEEARVDSPATRTNQPASTTEEARVDSPATRTNQLASATEEARVDSPAARTNRLASALQDYKLANPGNVISEAPQGSKEWLQGRHYEATASDAKRFTGGNGAQETYARNKAEIAAGIKKQGFVSPDLQRGNDLEPLIRQQYERNTGYDIMEVGQVTNPEFPGAASLDGIATKDGKALRRGVEIKAPRKFTPADGEKKKPMTNAYNDQVQMQMHIANLDQMDLVEGVVDENNELQTQVTTFNKDDNWAAKNKGKIQRAQDTLQANRGLTREQIEAKIEAKEPFLQGADPSAPKVGGFKQMNESSTPAKEELANAVAEGNLKAAEVIANDTSGKFKPKEVTQPTSTPTTGRKKKESESVGAGDGSGGGGGDWHGGAGRARKSAEPKPDKAAGGSGVPPAGIMGKALTVATAAWEAVGVAETMAAGVHSISEDFIRPALDYGLDPGKMLGQTLGQTASGMDKRTAISNSQNQADLGAQRELGDYSQSTGIVTGSLGVVDFEMLERYKDDPIGLARAIKTNGENRGMSPAAIARINRLAGLQQTGGINSMSEAGADIIEGTAKGFDELGKESTGNVLAATGTAATVANRRNLINLGADQAIQGGNSVADFVNGDMSLPEMPSFKMPEPSALGSAAPDTSGSGFTQLPLPTASPDDLGNYQPAPPSQSFQAKEPQAGSGGATGAPVNVNVTLQTTGVSVVVGNGQQTSQVTQPYRSTAIQ